MLWRAFRRAINEARVGVCGSCRHGPNYGQPNRCSMAFRQVCYRKPTDWPSNAYHVRSMGATHRRLGWAQALQDFLAPGEARIYVGFGSMVGSDGDVMRDVVAQCCRSPRAVLPRLERHAWTEFGSVLLSDRRHSARLAISANRVWSFITAVREPLTPPYCAGSPSIAAYRSPATSPFGRSGCGRLELRPKQRAAVTGRAFLLKLAINAGTTEMRNRATA